MADKQEILTIEQALEDLPADFQFFGERFRSTIQPQLLSRETDRVAAVKKQNLFTAIGAVLGIAAFLGCAFLIKADNGDADGWIIGAFIGVFVVGGMMAWGGMALSKLGKETKLMLIEPVSSEFGMGYQVSPGQPQDMMTFRSLGLVPGWDRSKYEDRLTGSRNDTPFEFFEAHLE
ncbi:MAG: hypothetical protein EON93_19995, partial [Burkholderiales bacterium]